MNALSRLITGLAIIVGSVASIIYLGFFRDGVVDYFSITMGFFFLILGFVILFNKREDEIERIKKRK